MQTITPTVQVQRRRMRIIIVVGKLLFELRSWQTLSE